MLLEIIPPVVWTADSLKRKSAFLLILEHLYKDVSRVVPVEYELQGRSHRDVIAWEYLKALFKRRGRTSEPVYIQKGEKRSNA